MELIQASVVILGDWNPRIFTPFWIKTQLFGLDEKAQINGVASFENQTFGFQYNFITILPRYHVLEIQLNKIDAATMAFASKITVRLFELLPHTPVKAMGVNLRFKIPDLEGHPLTSILKSAKLSYKGIVFDQVRHRIDREQYIAYIVTDISKDEMHTVFNFHYNKINNLNIEFIINHFIEAQKIMRHE